MYSFSLPIEPPPPREWLQHGGYLTSTVREWHTSSKDIQKRLDRWSMLLLVAMFMEIKLKVCQLCMLPIYLLIILAESAEAFYFRDVEWPTPEEFGFQLLPPPPPEDNICLSSHSSAATSAAAAA